MQKSEAQMLTVGKMAKELGASAAQVRKIIRDTGIEPDLVKSGCSYYGQQTVDKVREILEQ